MKEIVINGVFIRNLKTGIIRYADEVVQRLPGSVRIIIPNKSKRKVSSRLWEQFYLPLQIKRHELLWSPGNSGPLSVQNQVITIHDVIPIEHPEWFSRSYSGYYQFLSPRVSKIVRAVITDSKYSRDKIIELFNLPESKVIAIPLGVSPEFTCKTMVQIKQVQEKFRLFAPYLFIIGTLEPRKNIGQLFKSWAIVQNKFPGLELAVAGVKAGSAIATGFENIPSSVRLLGYVEDQDLPILYSGAEALVYPSLYEGFGLPVLEAMACGTPVAASNATSIPEVVGEAGLLFDPYNVEEMAWAMERLIQDSTLREELRLKGLERARQFTWEKTAQAVWEVLSQAMEV